jgi:hypothetical protein
MNCFYCAKILQVLRADQGFWCVRNVLANQSASLLQNLHSCGSHNPSGLTDSLQKVVVFWSEAFAPKNKEKWNWYAKLVLQHLLVETDDSYCYFKIVKNCTFKILLPFL